MTDEARWTADPYVIHINSDPTDEVAAATAAGAIVLTLPLAGLRDHHDLSRRGHELIRVPHPDGGMASLVDWITDLEWLGPERGVLLVVDAEDARPTVLEAIVKPLPFIVAWWRLWPQPMAVHLVNVGDVDAVQRLLAEGNAEVVGRPMAAGAAPAREVPVRLR